MNNKPLLIFYIHKLPYPYDTGTNQRIRTLVHHLRQYYRVGLIIPTYHTDIRCLEPEYDGIWYGSRYNSLWNKLRWRLEAKLRTILLQAKLGVSSLHSTNPLTKISVHAAWKLWQVCQKEKAALIVVQKIFNTIPATAVAHHLGIPVILDTHDLFYIGNQNHANLKSAIGLTARNIHDATAKDELCLLRQYDALIAIQYDDAESLRQHLPSVPVVTTLHPVAINHKTAALKHPSPSLLFVGSDSAHNVDALHFFLTDCFPEIAGHFPEVRLDICGSVAKTVAVHLPNVHLHGRVEDLDEYYAAATLVINPVRVGSGLKIKTVEALAHGKCLVTTPIGVEGLLNVQEAVVCSEPELLVANIIRLLQQPELIRNYEEEALRYAQQNLTADVCYQELLLLIEKLTTKTGIA